MNFCNFYNIYVRKYVHEYVHIHIHDLCPFVRTNMDLLRGSYQVELWFLWSGGFVSLKERMQRLQHRVLLKYHLCI